MTGEYAIVGIGQTEVGHLPDFTKREIIVEAARLALLDADLPRDRIEATIRTDMTPGTFYMPDYTDEFCRMLRLPVNAHFKTGRGGNMASHAILNATKLLDLGVSDYVLVSGGLSRWSRRHDKDRATLMQNRITPKMGDWGSEFGAVHALHLHAFLASRHMHEFGTKSEDLARIAVAQREWARLNPDAYMNDRPMTVKDHQDSPLVVEPYHLFDCCLESDAGAAFIVTSADNVDESAPDPVYISGLGFGEHVREQWWEKTNYTQLPVENAKTKAFEMADVTLEDIDFAQLYDCFTGEVLLQLEDYGWAEKGEGKHLVRDGRLGPDGDLPINTGGGLLSSHHLGDMTGLIEGVRQLRGGAGDRQVPDARHGIVSGHGGELVVPGMASHHSTLVLSR